MTENNKPEWKIRAGNVVLTAWKKEIEKNGQKFDMINVSIEKTYKDGDEWKTTNNFNVNDLMRLKVGVDSALNKILMSD